ncbi:MULTISPECIES: NAD(P)-dependent oxidoreductase [Providencia]|uniref:NAD(P)-dependent oxidoreductase n=1 Tax=Providencia hangzhouensis TaxID=3031799 RepID=A0ABY9Z8K7_9GAMM|nr:MULTISPECIES: NAD(P)-dependent oxidoreductase [Providencia]MBG5928825.1 bifunctional glyoxylate/hydroxypyruvate reductase B [Providencia rettgeri]MBN6364559.1 bifunctional glyoxylate/hydroxypyruvate reductase B [Providencia rettgeri]MBQ0531191.1 bifunctional glyoxylate/hydroxypyruvate reductase B [Providencia rettgeri]MBW3105937.1 bifunctional glyoxylate/hydroxypyruvate reductase B [Providencia rettgeri]MCG9527045.1 bifunctional glyoxylate/hydroxypyruvate reductase B [Providencia rettgeri]
MKQNIILYKSIPTDQLERLQQHFNVTVFDSVTPENLASFKQALSRADGIIGASYPITADDIANAPNLKAASTISVGVDQFDIDAMNARKIALMHTPNVLTETTADTIFTLVLCSARRIIEMAEMVKNGQWTQSIGEDAYGSNVNGKTIGILGMGRIGYAVAKRAYLGFGMPVLYYNNHIHPDAETQLKARRCDLDTLLAESDFVCVVLPLSASTEKLIGKNELAKMKPSAFLINGSRGRIVDEAALIDALESGTIRGAGLDVFEVEPLPSNSKLLTLPNVVALPHIGSATHETRYAMVECAVDNLIAALKGDLSQNCVNPEIAK